MNKKHVFFILFALLAIVILAVIIPKSENGSEKELSGDVSTERSEITETSETPGSGYEFFESVDLPSVQDASDEKRDFYVARAYSHLKSHGYTASHFEARFPSRVGIPNTPDGFYLFSGEKDNVTISLVNTTKDNEQCRVPMNLEGELIGEIVCEPYKLYL